MGRDAAAGAFSSQQRPGTDWRWRVRWRFADLTGRYYRVTHRLGLATRASRQAARHDGRSLPVTSPLSVAGPLDGGLTRIALVGNGPAESQGLPNSVDGFGALLARSLQLRIGGRVEVRTVLGAAWDLESLETVLTDARLHWSDALVVTASYRPQLAVVPLRAWRRYTEALRSVLVDGTEPGTVIRVLSLPWRQAARDLPGAWGGAFGNRVIVLAETAEAALRDGQPARPLRLYAPVRRSEWAGPNFSAQTYLAWADQVAQELSRQLRSPSQNPIESSGTNGLIEPATD